MGGCPPFFPGFFILALEIGMLDYPNININLCPSKAFSNFYFILFLNESLPHLGT